MRKLFIKVLFVFLLVVGCKNSTTQQALPQKPQILVGQKIELSDTYSAIDLEIVDSMLIFLCYGDQYKFHVYNKNTLKFLGKFGHEGRGPAEFVMPVILSQKMKIRDSSYLVIYDNVPRRLSFVNILKAINNKSYNPITLNLRNRRIFRLSLVASAVITPDSAIIGSSTDHNIEGRFFCYNISQDILTWLSFYPKPKKTPVQYLKGSLYKTYMALRPDGSNIAAAALFFERIDILDSTGQLEHSVVFKNQDEQDFSKPNSTLPPKGVHEYFTSLSVSQDFIYALKQNIIVGSGQRIDTSYIVKIPWDETTKSPDIYKMIPKVLKISIDEDNNKVFGIKLFSSCVYVYDGF